MDAKKFSLATLAGGVTLFLLGFIFYVVLLEGFFKEAAGASASVYRESPLIWSIFLGELCTGALLALIFGRWASIKTFAGGAKAGAIIGLLYGLGINLVLYGTTTMADLSAALADPLIMVIRAGIAGGVIGWVLGRGQEA